MALTEQLKQDQRMKINKIHAFLRDNDITSKQAAAYFGYEHKSFEALLHGRKFSYAKTVEMCEQLEALEKSLK